MNEPTPIVFGASIRAAASSCRRAGLPCRGADLFADTDTQALGDTARIQHYPADFCTVAESLPPSPWFYTGGLENYPAIIDQISRRHALWGNDGETVRHVRDPIELHRVLVEHNLPSPDVALNSPGHSLTWIRKPLRSCGGNSVELTNAGSSDCFFQEFVEGQPVAAIFVAGKRTHLLGVTRQLQGEPWTSLRFQYAGSVGPIDLTAHQAEHVSRLGEVIAQAFGLKGIFGVDGVMARQKFWTVEVNPRYTASVEVLERASRKSAIKMHMAMFLDDSEPVESREEQHVQGRQGKAIVFAKRPARIGDPFEEFVRRQNDEDPPVVSDLPHAGSAISPGQPICTVFAGGHSELDVTRRLHALVEQCREALDVATPSITCDGNFPP